MFDYIVTLWSKVSGALSFGEYVARDLPVSVAIGANTKKKCHKSQYKKSKYM
jgi:hypothetical protein